VSNKLHTVRTKFREAISYINSTYSLVTVLYQKIRHHVLAEDILYILENSESGDSLHIT
jgi:hypothetical protein